MIKKTKQGYITFCNTNRNFKENEVLNGSFLIYESIEDSLRFTTLDDDKVIAKVTALDDFQLVDSDYYDYYNMVITNKLLINKIYSYNEIIDEMLNNKNELQIERFLKHFKLKEEDIEKFKKIHPYVDRAARFYQEGDLDAYNVGKHLIKKNKHQ